jgi:6-phosphofructo-2-kinase
MCLSIIAFTIFLCFIYFIQSICDDPKVLAQNYALKLNNEDYKQMNHQKALDDFMDRVKAYELVYEVCNVSHIFIRMLLIFSGRRCSSQIYPVVLEKEMHSR